MNNQAFVPTPTPRKSVFQTYQQIDFSQNDSTISLECENSKTRTYQGVYQSATLRIPTPRKPRKLRETQTLRRAHHNTRFKYDVETRTSSSSSMRQLLFTTSLVHNKVTREDGTVRDSSTSPNSSIYFNKQDNDNSSLKTETTTTNPNSPQVNRLQRPNAPPPPPPPPIGFISSINTDSFGKMTVVSSIPRKQLPRPKIIELATEKCSNSFDYLGFENYTYKTEFEKQKCSSSSIDSYEKETSVQKIEETDESKATIIQNSRKRLVSFFKKCICLCNPPTSTFTAKKETLKKSINSKILLCNTFDAVVLILCALLFLFSIVFIISFQTKVHEFYKLFLNNSQNVTINKIINDSSSETFKTLNEKTAEEEKEYMYAGSQLVNKTVLFCNSPYFSYQINNLAVLPFSLGLTIIFSFFSKRDTLCATKCGGRPGLPGTINPFLKRNRFVTAALFCILANEVFKMLESSMFDISYNQKSFNTTSELLSFVSENFKNNTDSKISSSNLLAIGFGIQPDFVHQKSHPYHFTHNTTTKSIMILGPATVKYLKPKLPPRIDLSGITEPPTLNSIFNSLVNDKRISDLVPVEHRRRFKNGRNRTLVAVNRLNETIVNGTLQSAFLRYGNMTPTEILRKAYEMSTKMPHFKWTMITQKLEKLAVMILEVLIIGMRYYPLLGILDKDSIVCLCLGSIYMWADMVYSIAVTGLCEGLKLNLNFDILKHVKSFLAGSFITGLSDYIQFDLNLLPDSKPDNRLLFSTNRIIYTVVKSLPHFFCLSYVTIRISATFIQTLYRRYLKRCRSSIKKSKNKYNYHTVDTTDQSFNYGSHFANPQLSYYMNNNQSNYTNLIVTQTNFNDKQYKYCNKLASIKNKLPKSNGYITTFEDKYVNNLLNSTRKFMELKKIHKKYENSSQSCIKRALSKYFDGFCKYLWQRDNYFRFSTRVICTYTVCYTVSYYLTCFIIFYGYVFIEMLMLPNTYKRAIMISACLSAVVSFIQLFSSLKNFRLHLISLYKGSSEYINSKEYYSNQKIALANFNFSGYSVTYTCWGYFILFLFITFIAFQVATVMLFGSTSLSIFIMVVLVPFFVSVFLISSVNKSISRLAAKFCFLQRKSKVLALKNGRLYSFFIYYKFFYDCFMGIASCLVRMFKSMILGILFMSRLDYSFMGRSLERLDTAFMSYVGFLHWEAHHTNPTLISFTQLLQKIQRKTSRLQEKEKIIHINHNRVVNRWHLYRLLSQNMQLIQYRKPKLIKVGNP